MALSGDVDTVGNGDISPLERHELAVSAARRRRECRAAGRVLAMPRPAAVCGAGPRRSVAGGGRTTTETEPAPAKDDEG